MNPSRSFAAYLLSLSALLATVCGSGAAQLPIDEPTLRPTTLRCEYRVNPLGIDATQPRLSWVVESPYRAQIQTAYQLRVATTQQRLRIGQSDLWDSGKVQSDETAHIVYEGRPLRSGAACYWQVRVWDGQGRPSAWSGRKSGHDAFWEMGLLQPSDWRARWISLPPSAGPPQITLDDCAWVWYPEGNPLVSAPGGPRFFRRVVDLPAGGRVEEASFVLNADDSFILWVNGRRIPGQGGDGNWSVLSKLDVTKALRPGRNVIGIRAANSGVNPAGLVGKLVVRMAGGTRRVLRVDANWKVSRTDDEGWLRPDFDDGKWTAAKELVAFGGGPWGKPGLTPASPPAPFLRREIELRQPVRRARLYATARGVYELQINGRRVGDAHLAPGWTDYKQRIQYQTYDVTDLLQEGPNALGAILGDGWYAGYIGFARKRQNYGSHPSLLLQLQVQYADGARETFVSNERWRGTTGPILYSDMLMGEAYDARQEVGAWSTPGYDAADWEPVTVEAPPAAKLVAQPNRPVRATEELKPKTVTEPKPGVFVFDLAQNMVGWARLRVRGKAGDQVTLRFAEMLNPDGSIYTTNLRSAKATDVYTLKGDGEETYEPRFTFHGFRYVELTGYPGRPGKDAITGIVLHSDTPPVGKFECSNPMVNQLQSNIRWGQRGNFLSIPTDCPQRDERLGWLGDAQVFVRTSAYNMDVAAFFTKWMRDVSDAQSAGGAFPDVAPRLVASGDGAPAWGDAGIIVPWTIYRMYGDTRIIEEHYQAMARWIEYIREANPSLLRTQRLNNNYGDWLSIAANTPKDVIATAYFAYDARLMSEMALAIGKREDAREYDDLYRAIRKAFIKAYVTPDGRVKGDTQTSYLLALHMGLLPDELRERTIRRLVDDIAAKKGHLSTGFVGVGYLCPTLSRAGKNEVAYRLLNNETFPSWGYSIKQGATTIWERWDGWTEDKGFQNPGMNSFNHYSLGSVGEWMFGFVAGIDTDPKAPGFKRVVIHPRPGGGLKYVRAEYESIRGKIATHWRLSSKRYRLQVRIPANVVATVYVLADSADGVTEGGVPADKAEGVKFLRMEGDYAVYAVGSGRYNFRSHRPASQ